MERTAFDAVEFKERARFEFGSDPWLLVLGENSPSVGRLLEEAIRSEAPGGFTHTLREICQQPVTWQETATVVPLERNALRAAVNGYGSSRAVQAVALTGSGSSLFVAECLAPVLQRSLAIPVKAVGGGELLTSAGQAIPPCRPCLVVSFARSGMSPESCGAIDVLLETEPDCRHLAITCNRAGRLATNYRDQPAVWTLNLPQRTCDQSLVMTSSFSNMILAGRFLSMLDSEQEYVALAARLAAAARRFMLDYTEVLAETARTDFRSTVYLGSGCNAGVARESALKMLEMTAGRVGAFAETYLGLRHGPMSAVHRDTLLICFLASDPLARAYEADLIDEINRKALGVRKVVVGARIPPELLRSGDLALECQDLDTIGDEDAPVIHALAGQWLGFFRCMAEGLQPDTPSQNGVISRVVETFRIHTREQEGRG